MSTSDEGETGPPASAEPMPTQIGRYVILEHIGAGGMGTVYKAQDPQLGRIVALKLPHFDGASLSQALRLQRFQREARAAAQIMHPHVCPIYDVGESAGRPFIVMAYIEGASLAQQLERGAIFRDCVRAAALAMQVLDALEAVHSHAIIHRDLKPGNIMLDASGTAILTDFGLARADTDGQLTSDGVVVGTVAYMAPEQATGLVHQVGPWTDLYSLGVILYQMLLGRLPFVGAPLAVLAQIGQQAPPRPSSLRQDLNPALEAILLKALAKDPHERYRSARQFKDALATWANATPSLAEGLLMNPQEKYPSTTLEHQQAPKPRSTRRALPLWIRVLAVVVILGVVGAVAFSWHTRTRGPQNPFVTRENYVRIRPGMTSLDVNEILGSGEVIAEEGLIVDSAGRYKRWNQSTGGMRRGESGTNSAYIGKTSQETKWEAIWRSGDKAIYVTFLNDKVPSKREQGLYSEESGH